VISTDLYSCQGASSEYPRDFKVRKPTIQCLALLLIVLDSLSDQIKFLLAMSIDWQEDRW